MSHRPINMKRANRVRKAFRATPETMIDLVQYLKDRRYAQTTGEAEKMILDGKVRSESHKLGITTAKRPKDSARVKVMLGRALNDDDDFENQTVVQRLVPAKLRSSITVVA